MDDLQDMAGKYADTVEENRKLYNEVQDLKGNIRVFCRIRPPGTTGDQNPSCLDTGVDGEVGPMIILHPAENKRKDCAFRRQLNEKPSVIPGCPGSALSTYTESLLAVLQQTACHMTLN